MKIYQTLRAESYPHSLYLFYCEHQGKVTKKRGDTTYQYGIILNEPSNPNFYDALIWEEP